MCKVVLILIFESVLYCQNPNLTSTQPIGLDVKMTLHTPHHHPYKLNVSNISAFTEPILLKL